MQDGVGQSSLEENIAKYSVKDSVFSDLFKRKKYLLQLYKTLHPEDETAAEDGLTDVTIKNVLTDGIYNDLGFLRGERFVILLEAQSTWTVNIIIRALLYLAQTYHDYFARTEQNLYKSRKVKLPKPELYVVYTGGQGVIPGEISLSKEFFDGEDSAVDVKVKVICENNTDSIINQYIIFCKVYNEQMKLYDRTRKAIMETIRICKDKNVLREYLTDREKEVVSIMMCLFDEVQITKSYIMDTAREMAQDMAQGMAQDMAQGMAQAMAQGMAQDLVQERMKDNARRLLKLGKIRAGETSDYFPDLSDRNIKELEAEIMQLA